MARIFGLVACAIALLLPSLSGGVRSAPFAGQVLSSVPRHRAPTKATPAPQPFVSPHARTSQRQRHAPLPRSDRQVVLTFDDGPDLDTTPLVLEALDQFGVKAAFFVAGRRLIGNSAQARARRALLQEIAARGHLVANHTVRHKNLCKEPQLIDDEIDHNQRILTQMLGHPPKLFRPPFGAQCPQLDEAIAQRQLVSVGWTIDPQDWRTRDPAQVANYVYTRLQNMEAHAVLLMHDTRKTGVRALPLILQWLADEQARASRGETRPIAVVSPSALLPEHAVEPTGLEPVVEEWAQNLALLPGATRLGPAQP